MRQRFGATVTEPTPTSYHLAPGIDICQTDYPVDWYQPEFIPYAEEYEALPDRTPESVLPWMEKYLEPALKHFGSELLLLAHYYMGGEIVKLVERFGGRVADSYQLALMARDHPESKYIVESAVHFMAETIAILSEGEQRVYITNPKAGCTMEMHSKDWMVEPCLEALNDRYGRENILPVCYMNTSGRIKAMSGEQGGAVCTSSNVEAIFRWALEQDKRILFIPDRHMGDNVAARVGIGRDELVYWPSGHESGEFHPFKDAKLREEFDRARLFLFGSYCSVHTFFEPWMVEAWKEKGYTVVVHPECPKNVADLADGYGSTAYLWSHVLEDKFGTGRYAVATEGHFVRNLRATAAPLGIDVVNLGEAKKPGALQVSQGCGCATMSRNDPPHLVAMVDLLHKGCPPDMNQVLAGDVVNEFTGRRERLDDEGQAWIKTNAKAALQRMIEITDAAAR